jgi:GNAT superfamily N-acetyltransferase
MITVSGAEPGDAGAIAALLEEMDRFYGAAGPESPDERARQVTAAIFASPPAAHALLARHDGEVAGIAAYSFLWPAVGLTRSLYLKELYVSQEWRRQGVGKLLMNAIFEAAGQHRCSRVEWTTDTGNPGAQAFYAQLGLPVHSSKVFYRVEDAGTSFQQRGGEVRSPADAAARPDDTDRLREAVAR